MTHVISAGPPGGVGNAFTAGISRDGARAWFGTEEPLVAGDRNQANDLYEYSGGQVQLLSGGGPGLNPAYDTSGFAGASEDGLRVFLGTTESLVPSDSDLCTDEFGSSGGCRDIYERVGDGYTLISTGPSAGGSFHSDFLRTSPDGGRVLFETGEDLVPEDSDPDCPDPPDPESGATSSHACVDIYERSGAETRLITTGSNATDAAIDAEFDAASGDAARVLFTTTEPLVPEDNDTREDIYLRAGDTTTLVSVDSSGANHPGSVTFRRVSEDFTRVFFSTTSRLVAADTDNEVDSYERSGGQTTLLSLGPMGGNGPYPASVAGVSRDGNHVFFGTFERMTADDMDNEDDIYENEGGIVRLVSIGPSGGNGAGRALYAANSPDGQKAFFTTTEQLTPDDQDTSIDLYERQAGTTRRITAGIVPGAHGFDAQVQGMSEDGSRVFFRTDKTLLPEDRSDLYDLYEWAHGGLTLLTKGPDGRTGRESFWSGFRATPDGRKVLFTTRNRYLDADADGSAFGVAEWNDVYLLESPAGYPRPRGTARSFVSLVIAYDACASPDAEHGAPLSFGSCTSPDPSSQWLTAGTPDANGRPSRFRGAVKFKTVNGNASTPADEADVWVHVTASDVRERSSLADYGGELELRPLVRITDRRNGSPGDDKGTVMDLPFSVPVGCTATAGTAGSTCAVTTTFDAVAPGALVENSRAVWALRTVELFDGGADGEAATGDNTPFARQGLFVP